MQLPQVFRGISKDLKNKKTPIGWFLYFGGDWHPSK